MRLDLKPIMAALLLFAALPPLRCQEAEPGPCGGGFFSTKGCGVEFYVPYSHKASSFILVSAGADLAGVLSGNNRAPGGFLRTMFNYNVANVNTGSKVRGGILAGVGFMGGYLSDTEPGSFGPTACFCVDYGLSFRFPYNFTLLLKGNLDLGIHFDADTFQRRYTADLYKRGICRGVIPELSILFDF